jgi:hypothetical protein
VEHFLIFTANTFTVSSNNYASYLSNSTEQTSSWEENNHSWHKKLSLMKPQVCYSDHKNPPWFLYQEKLIQFIPSHPISFTSILILSFHFQLGLSSEPLPFKFLLKILYTFLISPMWATCPTQAILLDLMILIFGKGDKLWSSTLTTFSSFLSLHLFFYQSF